MLRDMGLLQPGSQSCSDLRLSRCTSIANDESASNNSLGELFFVNCFFFFLFSHRDNAFSVGADWSSTDMQISRSRWQDSCLVVWSSCNRGASLATKCACLAARRSQTTFRPATTVSGNCFFVNSFSFFLFSHRENAFRSVRIGRRPTCRSTEAGGKTHAVWSGSATTGMPVSQRSALVLLRVDRKRRVGH